MKGLSRPPLRVSQVTDQNDQEPVPAHGSPLRGLANPTTQQMASERPVTGKPTATMEGLSDMAIPIRENMKTWET